MSRGNGVRFQKWVRGGRFETLLCYLCVALFTVLCLSGCGGGSSSSGVNPTLTINWGPRSRDITGPGSAVSIYVQLTSNIWTTVDRATTPTTAYSQTYTLPLNAPPGTYTALLQFCSLEGGAGGVVGQATAPVTLSSNSTSLGTFTTVGTVATVGVLPGQTVPVGSSLALNAAAYDNTSTDLVVTPGSIQWNVVSNDGSMTFNNGYVTANSAGTISVTATVDGVTSPAQTVTSYSAGAVTNCTNSTYTPNYATEMENSTVGTINFGITRHWTSFPVTIAIVQNAYAATFTPLAQTAMNNWTNATGGQVTFQVVAPNASPDITITFQPSSTIDGSQDGVVGLTTVYTGSASSTVLSHADIEVASDLGNNNSTLNDITHELGHSLGIGGHSDVAQDLMFAYLNDSYAPAADDVNTLYTAYCGSFPQTRSLSQKRPASNGKPITIIDTKPK